MEEKEDVSGLMPIDSASAILGENRPSEETLFSDQIEALEYQNICDGLDPNLLELYLAYPDICRPIFERLAYDSEYRRILERFEGDTSQLSLSSKSEERIINVFEDKQKVLKRILTY